MSWESGNQNIFFARSLNSYAEAQLDAFETEPFVKIADRLHQLGIFDQHKRYSVMRHTATPDAKWLGTLYVEPLDMAYKVGGMAYRDMMRMVIWQPDSLTPKYLAHDLRVDLTRAEIAICQSAIDPFHLGDSELAGPYAQTIRDVYTIQTGPQYDADLTAMWDTNLHETPADFNLQKFHDLTEDFTKVAAAPVPCAVTHRAYGS